MILIAPSTHPALQLDTSAAIAPANNYGCVQQPHHRNLNVKRLSLDHNGCQSGLLLCHLACRNLRDTQEQIWRRYHQQHAMSISPTFVEDCADHRIVRSGERLYCGTRLRGSSTSPLYRLNHDSQDISEVYGLPSICFL